MEKTGWVYFEAMKKIYIILVVLIGIIIYLLFRPPIKVIDKSLIDYFESQNKAKEQQIKADSIRYTTALDSLLKREKTIQNKRINELNKFQQERNNWQRITSDSSFSFVNDSILKMLRSR